jgi:hypothetical protein
MWRCLPGFPLPQAGGENKNAAVLKNFYYIFTYASVLDYNGNAEANKIIYGTPLAMYNRLTIMWARFALA